MRYFTVVLSLLAALSLSACGQIDSGSLLSSSGSASSFAGCKAYPSTSEARDAWKQAGSPARYDGDGDGVVCESGGRSSGSSAKVTGCKKPDGVVKIGISSTKYPNVLKHIDVAVANGFPRVITINRDGAEERRAKLLAGIPTKPGHDRDEWPMAMGRSTWKADVMHIPSSENRSAGSVVGVKLRQYCDGTRFTVIGY